MKRNLINISLFILVILLFSSCAHVVDIDKCVAVDAKVYGFWNGLWHGFVAPFTFLGSLFNEDISVYAVNNNGNWYVFGFILGIGGFSKGSSSVATSRRRRRR